MRFSVHSFLILSLTGITFLLSGCSDSKKPTDSKETKGGTENAGGIPRKGSATGNQFSGYFKVEVKSSVRTCGHCVHTALTPQSQFSIKCTQRDGKLQCWKPAQKVFSVPFGDGPINSDGSFLMGTEYLVSSGEGKSKNTLSFEGKFSGKDSAEATIKEKAVDEIGKKDFGGGEIHVQLSRITKEQAEQMEESIHTEPKETHTTDSETQVDSNAQEAFRMISPLEKICNAVVKDTSACESIPIIRNDKLVSKVAEMMGGGDVLGLYCDIFTGPRRTEAELKIKKKVPEITKEDLDEMFEMINKLIEANCRPTPSIVIRTDVSGEALLNAVIHEYGHFLYERHRDQIKSPVLPTQPVMTSKLVDESYPNEKKLNTVMSRASEPELLRIYQQQLDYYSNLTEEFAFTFELCGLRIIKSSPTLNDFYAPIVEDGKKLGTIGKPSGLSFEPKPSDYFTIAAKKYFETLWSRCDSLLDPSH